ncbi:MAG: Abi family protein [Deltaproteobacteria bacterium]|nr:Abi family protein [Deltaproteobacteria bacterium]
MKKPLSFDEQVKLLKERGMESNKDQILKRLKVVNYYRLSGYWFPFKKLEGDDFEEGTTVEKVWERYSFDRKLRLLVIDAIERVEVALRTQVAYVHALKFGAFAYLNDSGSLPDFRDTTDRNRFKDSVKQESERSKEQFVKHFNAKYSSHKGELPVWMVTEVLNLGAICRFFRAMPRPQRRLIATAFNLHERTLASWMVSLNSTRNICAHHGRLWNRVLPIKPQLPSNPKRHAAWYALGANNNKIFATLTLLGVLLKEIAPKSQWKNRVLALLEEYPEVPRAAMGFPSGWESNLLWK